MSKHTPGPWIVSEAGDTKYRLTIMAFEQIAGHMQIAEIEIAHTREGSSAEKRAQANARLIAAAPELLEALKWAESLIVHNVKETEESTQIVAMILRTIAKAEGGEK